MPNAKFNRVDALLPLPLPMFHMLLALSEGERHGYALKREILHRTGGKLNLGSGALYGSINKMLEQGLIEESDERPDPHLDDERRRYYRITPLGLRVAQAEAVRMRDLAQFAQDRLKTAVTLGMAALFMIGVITVPQCRAQAQPLPAFQVASVRLTPPGSIGFTSMNVPGAPIVVDGQQRQDLSGAGSFTSTNVTLELLIEMAFQVDQNQILGEPDWLGSQHYDVSAKPDGEAGLTSEQLKPLLRQLLEQRFKLATHRETKTVQGYRLVIAKSGPKLRESSGTTGQNGIFPGGLRAQNMPLTTLASMLSRPTGRPVVDKTGVEGLYDIQLNYAPDGAADSSLPSVYTALQEQLGLKLEPQKVPVEMLVIEHLERVPTEN